LPVEGSRDILSAYTANPSNTFRESYVRIEVEYGRSSIF